MGFKRSINREMKKLGYLPMKNKLFRRPEIKNACLAYSNGETEIGLFNYRVSRERSEQLPFVNRTVMSSERTSPGDVQLIVEALTKPEYLVARAKGQNHNG